MSDKQTLQSQIASLKNVLASPKTDGTTRKILENGLKKAEAKLEELEKAEKLESSKKELTPKQEAKVEEVKKETKSLAQTLKDKVAKAKQKIATTTPKATKKGGARSVAKAKDLAKQRRSTQKKQSLADKDIESDANRYAINKSKRRSQGGRANQYGTKAENKGGVYYEKRENRYDVQNKRYAKLEGGGGVKYPTDLKVGSVIQGVGFPMLKGIDGGNYYTIVEMDNFSATFVKSDSKGNKKSLKKVRHKLDSIEGGIKTAKRGDENGILVVKYADGGAINDFGGTTYSTEDLSGMFAKGGMTEHGLMVGDMIVSVGDDPYSIVVRNNGMESMVDLNDGTRMSNNQGTRFASRSMKDPMVVRTQFEEMDFEYGDGGYMASGGRITKGAKYMAKFNTSGGDSGYSIYKIVDTDYFSNKYGGSPHTIRYEVIESSHEKVGSFDESSRKDIQTQLKYGMWTKLDNYADGGTTDFGGTIYSNEDLSGMFKHGGGVEEGNIDMVKNQVIQVEHHAKELMQTLKSNPQVDAWVVAKMDRATSNLSDITHYLEGEKKSFGMGGKTTFDDKVKAISESHLKRKKVSPSVQKDYGKTYSKDEAIDSAKRIAGAMRKKEMSKKKS